MHSVTMTTMMNGKYLGYFGHSEIGPSHVKNNINNQDAWCIKHFDWGQVIVVSDGVGSKSFSEFGSKAVCQAAIKLAHFWYENMNYQPEVLLNKFHEYWIDALENRNPNQCSCTSLWVIHCHGLIFMAQLGDGLLSFINPQGEVGFLIDNFNEISFSNQTFALQEKHHEKQWNWKLSSAEEFHSFLLMTDGISDDLLQEQKTSFVKGVIEHYSLLGEEQAEEEIKGWLKSWPVPNHQDDKTIACIYTVKD